MERQLFSVALAVALLALLAIALPLATGEVYVDTDLGNAHLPIRYFYAESLAAGHGFDWFPYQFNGVYLHGEGQFGLYHPLNWLSYRGLPLQVAFNLELLRNYALLLLGSYWLARRWRLPRDASMLGAILFGFGSFNTLHFMHVNMLAVIAHLPFLLVAIDTLLRTASRARAAWACLAISLLTASQVLLGFPQALWLSFVAEGLYALVLLRAHGGWARLGWLVAAQGIALLIGAIQLLPQLEALELSERAVRGPDLAFEHSLHPLNLLQLVSPLIFVERGLGEEAPGLEFALYAGSLLPVALAWLWIRRSERGPLGRATALLLLASALFLLLSLGDWGGLYQLQTLLPVVNRLRAPARYVVLFQLAAAGLVALAYADMAGWVDRRQKLPWRSLWCLLVPLGIAAVAFAAALATRTSHPEAVLATELSEPLRLAAGPLLVALAGGCVAACARGHRAALAALLLFAAADPVLYGLSFISRSPTSQIDAWPARWNVPVDLYGHRLHWGPPALSMRRIRLASGYAALVPRRRLATDEYAPVHRPSRSLLASFRVSDIAYAHGRPVPGPLPRARLVTRTRAIEDLALQMGTVDVETTALVERPLELDSAGAAPGRASIQSEQPGDILIETKAASRQLLVLAESHHRGWRVQVDGQAAEVERVYGDFMGVIVPPGERQVRFSFEPESLRQGRLITLLGVALLVPLYWFAARSALWRRPAA